MVIQLIRWVDLPRSMFNLEDTEEHDDAPPSPNRHVPPFAGNSSLEAVRLHPHRGQQLARSLHKNIHGRERKLDGAAKKVGRQCVRVRILSACLPFCQRIST